MSTGNSLAMMPWFPRDYIAATRHMTLAQRGAYCDLLFYQWEMGPLPEDTGALCRLLGCSSKEFSAIWRAVGQKFVATAEGYVNSRLEEHRSKSKQLSTDRSQAGRAGGIKSAEQRRSKTQATLQATVKQSEPFASSKVQPPSPSPSPSLQKPISHHTHTPAFSSPLRAATEPEKGSVCGTFTKIGGGSGGEPEPPDEELIERVRQQRATARERLNAGK